MCIRTDPPPVFYFSVLFNDTIYNNIRYGRLDALPEEIYQAAKVADLHNSVVGMKGGCIPHQSYNSFLMHFYKTDMILLLGNEVPNYLAAKNND